MATTKSTIRTTTIRMNAQPVPKKKPSGKHKPMSDREKRKAAQARAKAKERAKRKALRQKARMRRWVRIRQSNITHWLLTGVVAVALLVFFYHFYIRPYSFRWKPCYGYKGYGVCLPINYKVHGIDVSHHQGEID